MSKNDQISFFFVTTLLFSSIGFWALRQNVFFTKYIIYIQNIHMLIVQVRSWTSKALYTAYVLSPNQIIESNVE